MSQCHPELQQALLHQNLSRLWSLAPRAPSLQISSVTKTTEFSNQIRVQKAGTSFGFIVFQAMVISARE